MKLAGCESSFQQAFIFSEPSAATSVILAHPRCKNLLNSPVT